MSSALGQTFSGTVRAPIEARLSFRVPGNVASVHVDAGTRVRAGDLIARLDASDYQLEVEAARASLRQAEAAAENARAEFRRTKALYAEDNASASAYDRARTAYETAESRVEAAERQLDLAKKRLRYTRLVAPATGSIADTHVEVGENVSVGQPVAHLTSDGRLEVRVQVPENRIARLDVGQSASVSTSTLGSEQLEATVTEVASAPNSQQPTYPVVVTLDERHAALRSGMTARVGFGSSESDQLFVPPEAVSEDERGRFVYVVQGPEEGRPATDLPGEADGRIERRTVATGSIHSHGLMVTGGLSAGERVVTAGIAQVRDGDLVRVSRLLSEN
jgi:RND family efflux transporter MFP subunit